MFIINKFLTAILFIIFTGMRFGLMQVKTGLCHILSRFEVATCKDTPVRIVYEKKSTILQMSGEFRLSFNRMQFWNNTHTHTRTHTSTIYVKYRNNNFLITPLHNALLEMPVFSRLVGSCSVHYMLSTYWLLEPTS